MDTWKFHLNVLSGLDNAISKYDNQHLCNISLMVRQGGKIMIWDDLEPILHNIVSKFWQLDVTVLHHGGNSIALRRFQRFMKITICNIHAHFPPAKLFGPTFYQVSNVGIHNPTLLLNEL